jgi:peptidoglycan/xylan/chitin deacetylase (PgdA/CDA1 family)
MMTHRDVPPTKEFSWPEGVQCALSLTLDDAKPSQATVGLPLLDEYGAKATFYILPEAAKPDVEVWRKAVADGHEIGNHTLSHPCSGNHVFMRDNALEDYTLERIAGEIDDAQAAIRDLLGVESRTFAYTCGHTTVGRGTRKQSYIPLVAERFLAGRGWLEVRHNSPEFCDMAHLFGVPIDRERFEEAKRLIDDARKAGGWLILASHHVGPEPEWQMTLESTLRSICEYAQKPENGIWLDTLVNVAQYVHDRRLGQ